MLVGLPSSYIWIKSNLPYVDGAAIFNEMDQSCCSRFRYGRSKVKYANHRSCIVSARSSFTVTASPLICDTRPVSTSEWDRLARDQNIATKSFYVRCGNNSWVKNEGLKRVDYLGGEFLFKGFSTLLSSHGLLTLILLVQ